MDFVTIKLQFTRAGIILLFSIFIQISLQLSGQESGRERYKGVETGSETRYLRSEINGTEYKLLINLPQSYGTDSSRTYPVFYVLDGQWTFVNVVSGYYDSNWDGLIPEIIIVGLTWAGENPDYGNLRRVDYAPPVSKDDTVSGGDIFLSVLREEIIPFIDTEYRSNKKDRGLTGNSLGALYTHYCMFHANDLFNGFVILGPGLRLGDGLAFRYEEDYAGKNNKLQARVFMQSGEYDDLASINRMAGQIASRNYEGLDFENRIEDGMGHAGIKSEGHARGMIYIYKRPYIQLPDDHLQEYAGTYINDWGFSLKLTAEHGKLVFTDTDLYPGTKLYPVSETEFAWERSYNDFHFTRNEDGKVDGFELTIYDRTIVANKNE